ncbi:cation:proton antiporter regulatory subunit [Deinococcus pimensis]|uniref:cation:proton antiporter regulatory subunit n=1 Tax=Deinococcus pimensis TaxID=309888 RepID=UPI00048A0400|nr:cation:proton antiporter regulatory subunit [Deinococcus pimensis]
MVQVEETKLPGVGVRHDFQGKYGKRVGVLTHRDGRREIFVTRGDDPDACAESITLSEEEAEAVSDLLGGSTITRRLSAMVQEVEGLAFDWLPLQASSPFADHPLGDTRLRTRTGTSVVAVLRGGGAVAAPDPSFVLRAGDTVVVLGSAEGVKAAERILAGP